jgi:hypothetical protein
MKHLTPEAQLAILRTAARSGMGRHLHHWMVGMAGLLALLSLMLWHPVPLMIAAFLGIIGLAERRAVPNILNALRAYDSTLPATGSVRITITRWDMDDHYHAILRQAGQPDWAYDFIPQGWQPEAGSHPAQVWRLDSDGPPALSAVSDGMLIPRHAPQKLDANAESP